MGAGLGVSCQGSDDLFGLERQGLGLEGSQDLAALEGRVGSQVDGHILREAPRAREEAEEQGHQGKGDGVAESWLLFEILIVGLLVGRSPSVATI